MGDMASDRRLGPFLGLRLMVPKILLWSYLKYVACHRFELLDPNRGEDVKTNI